jgi:hypothetical protein
MMANQRPDELQEAQSERKGREVRKGSRFSEAAKLTLLRAKLTVHMGKIE